MTPDLLETQAYVREARAEPSRREDRDVILATHGLTKDFGKLRAVDGLDMEVRAGDVFGFLGPNGAGKTTVIRLVLGLIHPTSGHAEVAGHRVPGELKQALRHVGGFVDDPTFYPLMSARRNLRLLGSMTGPVSEGRIAEVLEIVGLNERADSRVGSFSHGMKQRLGIAQALLHAPELVVLDEPTSGLDPRGMKDVRELIRELGRSGVTVFLSSHLLHEVQQVCTRAVIIDRGRVVAQGTVAELRPEGLAVKVMTDDQAKAAETARAAFGASAVSEDDGYLVVKAGDDVPQLVRRLVADGVAVRSVVPATDQGLEDYFLELTARGTRPQEKDSPEPPEDESPEPLGEESPPLADRDASPAPPAGHESGEQAQPETAEGPMQGPGESPPASGPHVTIAVERSSAAERSRTGVQRPVLGDQGSSAPPSASRTAVPPHRPPPAPVDDAAQAAGRGAGPIFTYRAAPAPAPRPAQPSAYRPPPTSVHGAAQPSTYRPAPTSAQSAVSPSCSPPSSEGRRR